MDRHASLPLIAIAALLGACAGPFTAVRPSASGGAVTVTACGNSSVSGAGVVQALDGPPLGQTGSGIEPPRSATFCVVIANGASAPLRVDRSRLHLQCPREKQPWTYDTDETRFVVPPNEQRKFHVT